MKNRFNNLTSKEWLPFQKSWFKYTDDYTLYRDNIRFFVKFDLKELPPTVFYYCSNPNNHQTIHAVAQKTKAVLYSESDLDKIDQLQFALFDLRDAFIDDISTASYMEFKNRMLALIYKIKPLLAHRRFIGIFMNQSFQQGAYYPFCWDLAKTIASTFSLKDEKIGCVDEESFTGQELPQFQTMNNMFYALYFRKDENSGSAESFSMFDYFTNNKSQPTNGKITSQFPSWFILKPPPRKKNEILHPAKYPEDLVDKYVGIFTNEGDNVFDPMSGTGSTQLQAIRMGRNGYGIELNEFFCNIANERCREQLTSVLQPKYTNQPEFRILNKDARMVTQGDFPEIDYIITSPPYWDMLNMKGAEYQARRKEKGLQLNYSEDDTDLGNIDDYQRFLDDLVPIYFSLIELLKPGKFMTIVVKNIKKKGKNYPLAWDLAERLQERVILLPESFWLQDDISIAPYGYFNTYVSNTFHHYCLSFQKPLST
ncbi:hypothetical protein JW960_21845 [candidate division KSB1 bacterium]|nr:hypothetical protein [candidate division KSB1 bacterium]